MKKFITFTLLWIFIAQSTLWATRYYVTPYGNDSSIGTSWSQAFLNVQKAISMAGDDDEIWVATFEGYIHHERIVINRKNIKIYGGFVGNETLLSQRDVERNPTYLHGSYRGSTITCIDCSPTLDGFIITGGKGGVGPQGTGHTSVGGGIYIENDVNNVPNIFPVIRNCIIEECEADKGGAVFIYSQYSWVVALFENVIIKNNIANEEGGGIYSEGKVESNFYFVEILNNVSYGNGGGYAGRKKGTDNFAYSKIQGNKATNNGGGIFSDQFWLYSSLVSGNYAGEYGGGFFISNNRTEYNKGFDFTTITGNYAGISGGGIMIDAPFTAMSSIIWGNHNSGGRNNINGDSYSIEWSEKVLIEDLEYGDICGFSVVDNSSWGNLNRGNIGGDPLFVDYQYATANQPKTSGDFRLKCGSPAIDRSSSQYNNEVDIDGKNRMYNGIADLGAYEYDEHDKFLYVSLRSVDGREDGKSWETSYYKLEDAIAHAEREDCIEEIRIGRGTFTLNENESYTIDREIRILGGFRGIVKGDQPGEDPNERDWKVYQTILKGKNNSVFIINEDAVINGCHIVDGGKEIVPLPRSYGGGVLINNARVSIEECAIENCSATFGGGVYASSGNITLDRCTLRYNEGILGGAVYHETASGIPFIIKECHIAQNYASRGGGVYNESGSMNIYTSDFQGNEAEDQGGALHVSGLCDIRNTLLCGNYAAFAGGIYAAGKYEGSDPQHLNLVNVTMSGNHATRVVGGLYVLYSDADIVNSIIWGNSHSENTIEYDANVTVTQPRQVKFRYNILGNCKNNGLWNIRNGIDLGYNYDVNPIFIEHWSALSGPTIAGNYRLMNNSPAIDAGNMDANIFSGDLDGRSRVYGNEIDMGAFEVQPYNWSPSPYHSFTVDQNLSSDQQIAVKVYPNPIEAGNLVTVELYNPSGDYQNIYVEVINALGMVISRYQVNGQILQIMAPELSGQYVIAVFSTTGNLLKTKKLMVT